MVTMNRVHYPELFRHVPGFLTLIERLGTNEPSEFHTGNPMLPVFSVTFACARYLYFATLMLFVVWQLVVDILLRRGEGSVGHRTLVTVAPNACFVLMICAYEIGLRPVLATHYAMIFDWLPRGVLLPWLTRMLLNPIPPAVAAGAFAVLAGLDFWLSMKQLKVGVYVHWTLVLLEIVTLLIVPVGLLVAFV